MTTIDIFNRALGLIGHDRTIPDDDDTATTPTTEYVRCDREWDGARLAVLVSHPWNFLIQETPITEGADTPNDVSNALEYSYFRPTDCVRIVSVVDAYNRKIAYRVTGGNIITPEPEIKIVYMQDEIDPDNWPHFIVDAVMAELASRIALSMTANARMVEATKGLAIKYLSDAIRYDSQESDRSGSDGTKYATSRR